MNFRPYLSHTPDLHSRASGCPSPVIALEMKAAAREVCMRTNAWIDDTLFFETTAGVYNYEADYGELDGKAELGKVLSVVRQDDQGNSVGEEAGVRLTTLRCLLQTFPRYPAATSESGPPRYVTNQHTKRLLVAPIPDGVYTISMIASLLPAGETIMDDLYEQLKDTIHHGALQRLLTMPDKAWTNLELASYHAKQYIYKVTQLRADANLGGQASSLTVTPQPWAQMRGRGFSWA